ncbi:MAG: hypothetical protein AAB804_00305 [Patescibacteria group bacterium]
MVKKTRRIGKRSSKKERHFRVIVPGMKSSVLVQPVFDPDNPPPDRSGLPWRDAKAK